MLLHTSKALFRSALLSSSSSSSLLSRPPLFFLPKSLSFSSLSLSHSHPSFLFQPLSPSLSRQSSFLSTSPSSLQSQEEKRQKRKMERQQIRKTNKRREKQSEKKHPATSEFSSLFFGDREEDSWKMNREKYNKFILSPLLEACSSRGDLLLLHSKVLEDGIEFTPRNLTNFIQLAAVNNEMNLMWDYYQKAREKGIVLSDKTMRLIFSSLVRQDNLHRGIKVWKRMARSGIIPSNSALRKFQSLCERKGKPALQEKFQRYKQNPLSFIDPCPFTISSFWNGVNPGEENEMNFDNNNNHNNNNNNNNTNNDDDDKDNNNIDANNNNNEHLEDSSDSDAEKLPGLFDLDLKRRDGGPMRGERREGGREGGEELEEGWEEEGWEEEGVEGGGDEFPMGLGEEKAHIAFSVADGVGVGGGDGVVGGVDGGEFKFGIDGAPDLKMKVFGNTLMSFPPPFPSGLVWGLWKYEAVRVVLVGEEGEKSEIQIGPYGHYNLLQFDSNNQILSKDHQLTLQSNTNTQCGFWTSAVTLPRSLLPRLITKMNIFYSHPIFGEVEREGEGEGDVYPSDPREVFCYAWQSLSDLSPDLHQAQMYHNIPPIIRSLFNFGRKPNGALRLQRVSRKPHEQE